MNYHLYFRRPAEQLIEIDIQIIATGTAQILHLPKWRPGRYELQRFDKLISDVVAKNIEGVLIPVERTGTHTWKLQAEEGEQIHVSYVFYANQRDSGGSLFDAKGIYVNPCNLLLYQESEIDNPCTMTLHISKNYQIACGLPKEGNTLFAKDFHEMADSPFFAAPDLKYHHFQVRDLLVHLWFWGECQPDFDLFERDITAYTLAQLDVFGDCPVPEYHYLCQILPHTFRHGVEHQTTSVNTFGPGLTLMQKDRYESFIELLSHEFFHTWNVKYLRPADMYPYRYGEENYSKLHYVTEGVTSYYGDLMLYKGGVYSLERFLQNLNMELFDHYSMPAKDILSLEQSSFNSWINGYGVDTGIPNRRISFYTKGYIVSFLLDYEIRKNSLNKYSLDDVLFEMYQTIAKNQKGYTKEDFHQICARLAGKNLEDFWAKYIESTEALDDELKKAAKYFGLSVKYGTSSAISTSIWGLKLVNNKVDGLIPHSPAMTAGIAKGDEIVAINGRRISSNEDLWRYFQDENEIIVHYFHFEELFQVCLQKSENYQAQIPYLTISPFPTEEAEHNIEAWHLASEKLIVEN